jgi:NAD-reducing hydrogenase large subunit
VGGKRIHPAWVVPGGVGAPLTAEDRDEILAGVPDAIAATERALDWYTAEVARWEAEAQVFGDSATAYHALVTPDGEAEHYDGLLRVMATDGSWLTDRIDPTGYQDVLDEAVEPWSFLKSLCWKSLGYPDGIYRVGPLARVTVADRMGRALACPRRRGTLLHHYRVDDDGLVRRVNLVIATGHDNLARTRASPRSPRLSSAPATA